MSQSGAIYVHVPFCGQKCRYCDLVSFGGISEGLQERYASALCQEIALVSGRLAWRPKTIFIGGGTPTVLALDQLERILAALAQHFVTEDLVEYTVEANPGTLTAEKLALLRQYGVNRLSMGVQSARQAELELLGRTHTFRQAQEGVELARAAGFANISVDLIYGLPGQTVRDWRETLEAVLALGTEHLSLYQLKIEEGTVFGQWLETGRIAEFDDEIALEMYELGHRLLEAQGYQQYEISNYAQPGKASLHNQAYWLTEDYYGLGLAAHSFLRPSRFFNPTVLKDYLSPLEAGRPPRKEQETLTKREAMEETIFMGLRMNAGVDLQAFQARYDEDARQVFAAAIAKCQQNGWLEIADDHLRLTDQGRVLGNLVFVEFV